MQGLLLDLLKPKELLSPRGSSGQQQTAARCFGRSDPAQGEAGNINAPLIPSRWGRSFSPGFWVHLRNGVPSQGCFWIPEQTAHGPQRPPLQEKHAACYKVSVKLTTLFCPPLETLPHLLKPYVWARFKGRWSFQSPKDSGPGGEEGMFILPCGQGRPYCLCVPLQWETRWIYRWCGWLTPSYHAPFPKIVIKRGLKIYFTSTYVSVPPAAHAHLSVCWHIIHTVTVLSIQFN